MAELEGGDVVVTLEPYMRPIPPCPECGGPPDEGAGHDCEEARDATRGVRSLDITPSWERTAEWWAHVLAQHGFERDSLDPVISFIEQVRYLAAAQPDDLTAILERLRKEAEVWK